MKGISLLISIFLFAASAFGQTDRSIGVEKKASITSEKIIQVQTKHAENWETKISPNLNTAFQKLTKQKSNLNADEFIANNQYLILITDFTNKIIAPVLIRSTNPLVTISLIERHGGKIFKQINGILSAEIPLENVEIIASDETISYIEAGYKNLPMLDVSRLEIKADQVHSGVGLPQSYKGDGVVVGILDSGIDWEHADFSNGQGTRIRYLWDMSGTSNPPAGYNYGSEFSKTQIDNNQCNAIDGDDGGGHGTHVAATAAGSGGANSDYLGIAPESDIIFVKGFRNSASFADVDVVNGCSYIFEKAQTLGKPAVINLSLGGQFGPHDGTSLYEQSLSGLTGQGKIITAAAGNEGSDFIHLSYTTSGSSLNDANQTFWVINQGASMSLVDMWYDTGNISVSIAAFDQSINFIGATTPVAPGQKIEDVPFQVGGTTYGIVTINATTVSDPNNGDSRVYFIIDDGNGAYDLSNVYWALLTFGNGTFDAWMATGGYFSTDNNPATGIYPGDNNKSIGIPGTAQKLICVGSYVTKNQWVDIDGNTWTQGGNPTIGALSSFSSRGPSRDGRMKPDLSAPGEVIVAALSGDVTIGPGGKPRSNIIWGGQHQKMQGTSMATPHVAGTIALMLQRNPLLDYSQALNILQTTARKDGFTGSGANNNFGHGKLDALAAVQNTSGSNPVQVTLLEENFEGVFLPGGWSQIISNASYTWSQGNPQGHNFNTIDPTSTNSAICQWVAANQNEFLITPYLQLADGVSFAEFYAGYSTQWLGNATMNLLVSTDGTNFTQVWTAENDGQSWDWRLKLIDLSQYANHSIKIAWQYVGNDGDLVGLDAIRVITTSSATDVKDPNSIIPDEFSLSQNYPNPFNPATKIKFVIPSLPVGKAGGVEGLSTIKVYDLLGREVATLLNKPMPAGTYEVEFNAANLPSGVYFYRLTSGNFTATRKLMLLK